jgi:hypothetical protein
VSRALAGPLAVLPAHGVGSREDLPLPFHLLLVGAGLALVVSFVALGALWKQPRLHREDGRLLPIMVSLALDSAPVRAVFVALSLVNPVRWLRRGLLALARIEEDFTLAEYRLGYWPAALGLLAFAWLELVAPDNADLFTLRVAVLGYLLVSLVLGLAFGPAYLRTGDPFTAWSSLYGTLSPLGRRADGRWVLRTPLHGPLMVDAQPGLLAVTSVMLGTTAYDGFSGETRWYSFVQSSSLPAAVWETAALVTFCLVVAGSLALAAVLSARLAGVSPRGVASAFAPSLLPIAAGYLIAHYWSLWVWEGTHGLAKMSDPLGTGANLLGTAGLNAPEALIAPGFVAGVQVVSIITGHVLGVVLAHERAVALFPRRAAVLGQLPLLAVMVVYTVGGLTLLFSS